MASCAAVTLTLSGFACDASLFHLNHHCSLIVTVISDAQHPHCFDRSLLESDHHDASACERASEWRRIGLKEVKVSVDCQLPATVRGRAGEGIEWLNAAIHSMFGAITLPLATLLMLSDC